MIVMGFKPDSVGDLYYRLKAKFGDITEADYSNILTKISEMLVNNAEAVELIQYQILSLSYKLPVGDKRAGLEEALFVPQALVAGLKEFFKEREEQLADSRGIGPDLA